MPSRLTHTFNSNRTIKEKKTFIVLGSPRGGTSVISGILRIFGIYMGEIKTNQHEDKIIHDISKDMMSNENNRRRYVRKLIATIKKRNSTHDIWGWKLPNTIYFIKDVFPYLVNPHFLVAYRNPYDIAVSSCKRDKRKFEYKLLCVPINHYKTMNDFLVSCKSPIITTNFDNLVNVGKEAVIKDIAEFIDLDIDDKSISDAIAFCDYDEGYKQI